MRLCFGSDHAAIELRDALVELAKAAGHEIVAQFGPSVATQKADYPDVALELGTRVSSDPDLVGVLVCGTGQGMAMTANRIRGIRAVVCSDVFSAKMGRAHNDANVLCMGHRVVGLGLAAELLTAFCSTAFEAGRHQRRVTKLNAVGR